MSRKKKLLTGDRLSFALATSEVASQGHVAFADPTDGLVYATPTAARKPIGHFMVSEDTTGDGTKKVLVMLFREIFAWGFANDSVGADAVQGSDLFTEAFFKDDATVTTNHNTNTRPSAGTVIAIDGSTVFVHGPRV